MKSKRAYEHPRVDVTPLLACDVITTSGAYVPPSGGSGGDPDIGTDTGGGKYDLPFDF